MVENWTEMILIIFCCCSFQVLNLRNYYDIYEILTYPDRFEIKSQLQKLVQSVEVPSIEIHVDDAIVRLAQSGLKDFDIDKYTDNVSLKRLIFFCINFINFFFDFKTA